MASSIPLQLAETLQTAHIRHNPSAERDLAPSTAADVRMPVVLETARERKRRPQAHGLDEDPLELDALDDEDDEEDEGDEEDEEEDDDEEGDEDSPYSVIRPWDPTVDPSNHFGRYGRGRAGASGATARPHQQLPPLPDLRFEQSYLHSVAAADTWWKVGLVTARDQMLMPFVQGLLYNLAVCGWQYWNRSAKLSGQSVGARARRWWYGVNNWTIPGTAALTAAASTAKRPAIRRK